MAEVIITLKVMPDSPERDLNDLKEHITAQVKDFGGDVGKTEEEPIAFGLKALLIIFVMDEAKGSTEELEKQIAGLDGVQSVDVTDVRRAIG
tara:strand:- start:412 stop:687 length:276 start_codon:yes stop_codon:yes gene_type:complete